MNITVDYKKRQYGTGGSIRRYNVTLRGINGLYIKDPSNPTASFYETEELELRFRGLSTSAGRGWDEFSEAEVLGGRLELSHDAARRLANAILAFLNEREAKGQAESWTFEIKEKPEPRKRHA